MSPRTRYTFFIDPDLLAGLKALKARDGISESEAVRRAIAAFLAVKGIEAEGNAASHRAVPVRGDVRARSRKARPTR